MGNVVSVVNNQKVIKRICDLRVLESGYTVPWAYSEITGELDVEFEVREKGGTASMRVECVADGQYTISFEKPVYRNVFIDLF